MPRRSRVDRRSISIQAKGDLHVASLLGMTVNASPMNPIRPLRPKRGFGQRLIRSSLWSLGSFRSPCPHKTNKGLSPDMDSPSSNTLNIYESEYVFLCCLVFFYSYLTVITSFSTSKNSASVPPLRSANATLTSATVLSVTLYNSPFL